MKKIWAHALVKNEERYIWFAVMSVIDWVDKILIWDTGSNDKTLRIVKEIQKIKANKVIFRQCGEINKFEFPQLRQKMLEETKSDWVLTLDGDEIWWEDSIRKLTKLLSYKDTRWESIVVKTVNCVGDIYHFQGDEGARYEFLRKKGHFNLRAFSTKIPGLHAEGEHGRQGYFDEKGVPIQDRNGRVWLLPVSYLHMTHLTRSSSRNLDKNVMKRRGKIKYELGISFPLDFYYPEVFFKPKPLSVPSPWIKLSGFGLMKSYLETPLKYIKRKVL